MTWLVFIHWAAELKIGISEIFSEIIFHLLQKTIFLENEMSHLRILSSSICTICNQKKKCKEEQWDLTLADTAFEDDHTLTFFDAPCQESKKSQRRIEVCDEST